MSGGSPTLFIAYPVVKDRIWYRKIVSVECIVSQDQSRTLISELPQGTADPRGEHRSKMNFRGQNTDYKHSCCVGVPVSWFDQIMIEIQQKYRPRVGSRKLQIFNVYFSVHQCPDFNWFERFLINRNTFSQCFWVSYDIDIDVKILWFGRGIHQELTSIEYFEK